jgi:hypothetical protein
MIQAADGSLRDSPSSGEIEYFRDRGTLFQMVSVIASVVDAGVADSVRQVRPFALTLLPATKRGKVVSTNIDGVAAMRGLEDWRMMEPGYIGFDPFEGSWSMFGQVGLITDGTNGFLDEVGFVIAMFYLALGFDETDVTMMDVGMPTAKLEAKYRRKRTELLFQPFSKPQARRIWGVETPIELFLMQELARHGLHPSVQILITADGGLFPSWYHLWQDLELRHMPGLVTEADLFFSEERLAVFCDGRHHDRRPQRQRDEHITRVLEGFGIRSIRIPGRLINSDVEAAGRLVREALGRASGPPDEEAQIGRAGLAEAP